MAGACVARFLLRFSLEWKRDGVEGPSVLGPRLTTGVNGVAWLLHAFMICALQHFEENH